MTFARTTGLILTMMLVGCDVEPAPELSAAEMEDLYKFEEESSFVCPDAYVIGTYTHVLPTHEDTEKECVDAVKKIDCAAEADPDTVAAMKQAHAQACTDYCEVSPLDCLPETSQQWSQPPECYEDREMGYEEWKYFWTADCVMESWCRCEWDVWTPWCEENPEDPECTGDNEEGGERE